MPDVTAVNILEHKDVRQELKDREDGWPTFPTLWVDGKCVGGLDVVRDLAERNKLLDVIHSSLGREEFFMQRELEECLSGVKAREGSPNLCTSKKKQSSDSPGDAADSGPAKQPSATPDRAPESKKGRPGGASVQEASVQEDDSNLILEEFDVPLPAEANK